MLQNINKFTGDNIGGANSFQFIPIDRVRVFPRPVDGIITKALTFKSWDHRFFLAYTTEDSLIFTEEKKTNDHGTFYDQILEGFTPKDEENLAALFDEMEGFKYIILYKDNNQNQKFIGSLESPLTFRHSLETKEEASGRNGYNITFSGRSSHKAFPFECAGGIGCWIIEDDFIVQ